MAREFAFRMRYANVQSAAIGLLRLPLAVLVVMHHACPDVVALADAPFPLLSSRGMLNAFCILCSNVIGLIAVACFFMISGFLFFQNIPRWNFTRWQGKMQRRGRTLALPYILWNLLPFAFCLLYGYLGYLRSGLPDSIPGDMRDANLYRILWDWARWGGEVKNIFGLPIYNSGPYDGPLWFMRDLLVVTALSPLIYVLVRYLRVWGLGLLFVCMYLHLWPQLPGFSAYSAFYFAAGACFAVHRRSIIAFALHMRPALYALALPMCLASVYFNCEATQVGLWIYPLFQLAGVFIMFILAARMVRRGHRPIKTLAPAAFFIYAFHSVALIPYRGTNLTIITNALRTLFGPTTAGIFATYVMSVILSVGISLTLYILLRCTLPRAARLLTGR
ncbi:MAG: acyltransferase [Muribaculaceae bacterium]|nr:acyltransferase [Muribaculaceae bacterium]